MSLLAPADVCRLGKICALFSSNHTGERAAAASKADQIVRAAGLTWPDVIGAAVSSHSAKPTGIRQASPAELLSQHRLLLTEWEKTFLSSLSRRHGPRTARQQQIFTEIHDRCVEATR